MSRPVAPTAGEAPLAQVQALMLAGRREEALPMLRRLAAGAGGQPDLLSRCATLFGQMGAHPDALDCYRRLFTLFPGHPDVLRGLAAAETANGLLVEAEAHIDAAIAADPADRDSWYNRAVLRRQTPEHNHIAALTEVAGRETGRGVIPLAYALAKELEDIGEHAESFHWLKRGADARRAALSYDVAADERAMALIAEVFSAEKLARRIDGASDARPIFIIGLPRTGTTLLERMLGLHSTVTALGELTELPMAVTRAAGGNAKGETIRRAGEIDFAAFGRDYLRAVVGHASLAEVTTDKLPSNFLYVGMLRLGLPSARIVHVRRRPLDSAYAIYKTLFRMGYPYSYDLVDLARYFVAYHRLMDHWRMAAPGYLVDIDYEDLVGAPEATLRALFERIDLAWEPEALDFHRQSGPVATASAAQVREPIHTASVGAWRRHADALRQFADHLRLAGIDPVTGEMPEAQ